MIKTQGKDISLEAFIIPDLDFGFTALGKEPENSEIKPCLHHIRRAFFGCFGVFRKSVVNWPRFLAWKDNPKAHKEVTRELAAALVPFVTNYYDFLTTAPPSKYRNEDNYCCFELLREISRRTEIPFIRAFAKRARKASHGIMSSLHQEDPVFVSRFRHKHKSILFVDDFLNSTSTARKCYEKLRALNNHVDGLIWCFWK